MNGWPALPGYFPGAGASVSRLADMPAFQRARSTLDDRCDEPPVVTVLHKVASYRFT